MRNRHCILFILLALAFFFQTCKKSPFDYRNKYTGTYSIVHTYSSWVQGQGTTSSGTLYLDGSVTYTKEKEGVITISYGNRSNDFQISKSGVLTMMCGAPAGNFKSKKEFQLNYGTNSCAGGGMGGGSTYVVTGTKK